MITPLTPVRWLVGKVLDAVFGPEDDVSEYNSTTPDEVRL